TRLANPAGGDGWLAGNLAQLGVQALAVIATVVYAAVGTAVILTLVQVTLGARAGVREQLSGLGLSEHGEEADFGGEPGRIGGGAGGGVGAGGMGVGGG